MNNAIKVAIENGRLVLVLGAGASMTSQDRRGRDLLSANALSKILAEEAGFEYHDEPLPVVYSAVRKNLGATLDTILEDRYRHCQPSPEYLKIAEHAWPRIYTLNIDDAFEKALLMKSRQHVCIRHLKDPVVDQDQFFSTLDYIKLNGSVDRIRDGLIFSPKEYGKGSAIAPLWYPELAEDFFKYKFLFIGTKLNEPLFYSQIERYRAVSGASEQRSYVLTPSATEIEANSLDEINLEHIPGTLLDFARWLETTFPVPLTQNDLAVKRHPELGLMLSLGSPDKVDKLAKTLQHLVPVSRSYLTISTGPKKESTKIRDFYKGFKPDWQDIMDDVPATLASTTAVVDEIKEHLVAGSILFVVTGPAGSGKTTLLKQAALKLSDKGLSVYFLSNPVSNLPGIISALEESNKDRYCLFVDRLGLMANEIEEVLDSGLVKKGMLVGAESQGIWDKRVSARLAKFCGRKTFKLDEIDEADAKAILEKLEKFGPWTRLSNLSQRQRVNELLHKAKRQLLIGLLETTLGIGFEQIIQRDYSSLTQDDERLLLVVVGLATASRVPLQQTYASRAMSYAGYNVDVAELAKNMTGMLKCDNQQISARHPVYVRQLFERVVSTGEISTALLSLMHAFSVYGSPVIKKVGRNEGQLFKSIINHSFLKNLLRSDQDMILNFYGSFEKIYENDGLFWLQYGLALRDFNKQDEAYDKLRTAYEAYQHPHTDHALAQQELVIASRSTSMSSAYALLDSARKRLESLDKTLRSDDTYPIVSLSEGHTNIIRKFEGDEKAKIVATYYANVLDKRTKKIKDPRLQKAWAKLTKYVVSGEWIEEDEVDDIW